ncbi:serine protease [Thelephora ganbajun]|uniref:Serine protease n=1 Tax=Thelephora ganbajun TaxID=370292 RepID=A0ACB6YXY8_THEGA|nr:serine protease [Thelephora ganbajun]
MSSSPLISIKKAKDAIPGRYIVTFKDSVAHDVGVSSVTDKIDSQSNVTHKWGFINGLAGAFTDADLELLRSHPDVASIEEDGHVHTQYVKSVTRTDTTWGLERISSQTSLAGQDPDDLTFTYTYNPTAGTGTDVYIIDTGIFIDHPAFGEFLKAAPPGELLCGYKDVDDNGHGTHCAGTAVSGPYGVANAANVIAVKVLDADGISGVDWVRTTAPTTGRPSVASMSLGGDFSTSLNDAVNNLVTAGVTTVVAAGDENVDAANSSPASATSVITIGAFDINDAKAYFSNFGAPLAIWGPGVNVISTWKDGGVKTLSGTSMATPHVAGFSAYLLCMDTTLTPSSVKSTIQSMALKDALSGIPSGTINTMLNNNLGGDDSS